jgi:hypothetical protein
MTAGTYLADPKGLERELEGAESLGDESGLGLFEALVDRGSNSSFRRLSCGVGGVELVAKSKTDYWRIQFEFQSRVRDALFCEEGLGRAELLQSPSSAARVGS